MSKPPFKTVLNALADTSTAFPNRYLAQFSDLTPLDLADLAARWPELPTNRKRSLLGKLVDLYQEDTLLSFEALAATLLSDPDEQIRAHSLRLLTDSADTHLLPRLVEMIERDPSSEVRIRAAEVLSGFVELGELDELPEETARFVEDSLLGLAQVEQADLQRAALEALGYSSRPEVAALIESAYARHDPKWVASALFAMARSASQHWEELVLARLDDRNIQVRRNAVQAAGELRLESARRFLLDLLEEEEDDEVFAAAIWSLSQIGGEDVRITLETLLDQAEDDDIIEFIEEAIENLDFTEELNSFDLLSLDPDDDPQK
jgi:HEAT repeat protein